jgi:hypothetical protein
MKFTLPPKGFLLNQQITFPDNALCFIVVNGSARFSYQFHSIDTDTYYSDVPIPWTERKELLPFSSYKGGIFSFDFYNNSEVENVINFDFKFEARRLSNRNHSLREYTLHGLYRKTSIDIEAGEEVEISLTNFRGGHYEVHQIYSSQNKGLSSKIEYHNKTMEGFVLQNTYRFKRPWVLRWPDSVTLILKNEGNSKLEIKPTQIYFAGYLLKPTDVLKTLAPVNRRDSFLIEGIRLR